MPKMKFTPKNHSFKYFNLKINIPEEHNYLAFDKSGTLYAYIHEPNWNQTTKSWVPKLDSNQLMEFIEIGTIESSDIQPEDSLIKIS